MMSLKQEPNEANNEASRRIACMKQEHSSRETSDVSEVPPSQLNLDTVEQPAKDKQVASGSQPKEESPSHNRKLSDDACQNNSLPACSTELQESPALQVAGNVCTLEADKKHKSASRDSSMNDDHKSFVDSISASSSRHMWGFKDTGDDDASLSPIRGDSISATIANFNNKRNVTQQPDNAKTSAGSGAYATNVDSSKLGTSSSKTGADDTSSKLNFYPAGSSTSGSILHQDLHSQANKQVDFVSVSSAANIDAFDIIEENASLSSNEPVMGRTMVMSNHAIVDKNHDQSCAESSDGTTEQKPAKPVKSRRKVRRNIKHSRQAPTSSMLEQALDIYDMPSDTAAYHVEPVILRGNGNLTLFGLSNSFSDEFPSALIGRVSKEEFERTMRRINNLLRDQQSLSAKLLLVGGLCCCCSLGFSLVWPSIALKKRSKMSLEKFLANENSRLYSKLGLNWKLGEHRCYSNPAFVEYVLMIEFVPKINLYLPD